MGNRITPPKHLTKDQKKKWQEIVQKLKSVGSYETTDLDLIDLYVVSWSVYQQAEHDLKTAPRFLVSPKTGSTYRNPLVDDQSNAFNQLVKLSTLLGLNPTGRKRLKLNKQNIVDPDDDFSAFGV